MGVSNQLMNTPLEEIPVGVEDTCFEKGVRAANQAVNRKCVGSTTYE